MRMVLATTEPATILTDERLRLSLAVRDWILGEAREIGDPNIILEGVSLKLRDAGIPIDRATSAVESMPAERNAPTGTSATIWRRTARSKSARKTAGSVGPSGNGPPKAWSIVSVSRAGPTGRWSWGAAGSSTSSDEGIDGNRNRI